MMAGSLLSNVELSILAELHQSKYILEDHWVFGYPDSPLNSRWAEELTSKIFCSIVRRSVDFQSFSLPSGNQVGRYSPTLARVELPVELDPCLITCVAYVRSTLGLSYTVVFGTSDGRLKCCSQTKIIMEVSLEESPLSVTIAESAHGVPVLVVSLGGMDRKVVTFFADSLQHINSWTGIHQVR